MKPPITVSHIVLYNAKESNRKFQCDDLGSRHLAFLHDELDPLVRKFVLQFPQAHELAEVARRLKLQFLNDNCRLAIVH